MRAHERTAQCPATDPPSAAQKHRVHARKDVPQHAAEPVTTSQQPQTEVLAGPLGGRGASGTCSASRTSPPALAVF